MGVLTTIGLIVLGGVVVTSAITAGCYFATEDDRAKAQIQENEANINAYNQVIQEFNGLKTKLNNAKSYLNDAKSDFQNGGHVLDGVPLANSEFTACLNKISNSITYIDGFISNLNSAISELRTENNNLRAKYDI